MIMGGMPIFALIWRNATLEKLQEALSNQTSAREAEEPLGDWAWPILAAFYFPVLFDCGPGDKLQ